MTLCHGFLFASFVLLSYGCARPDKAIRAKAESVLAEASMIELAIDHYTYLNDGQKRTNMAAWSELAAYLPTTVSARLKQGKDIFDNAFHILPDYEGVAVHPDTVRACTQAGLDAAFWGRHDQRVLDFSAACRNGDLERFETLLPVVPRIDISERHHTNNTPLALAAGGGHARIVKRLLERGADPNQNDGYPLWRAVLSGDPETVRALLAAGAKPTPQALKWAEMSLWKEEFPLRVRKEVQRSPEMAQQDNIKRALARPLDVVMMENRRAILKLLKDKDGRNDSTH